jgi:hypothetical protein
MTRPSAQCGTVWLDGVEFDVDPRWASPAVRKVIYDGSYEYAERAVLGSSLSPDGVFLEVGPVSDSWRRSPAGSCKAAASLPSKPVP